MSYLIAISDLFDELNLSCLEVIIYTHLKSLLKVRINKNNTLAIKASH